MSIQKFFARTTSEALRKVRDVLGPDAIILSNRDIDGGIEILAAHHDHISSLIPSHLSSAPHEAAGFEDLNPRAFRHAPGILSDKESRPRRDESRRDESRNGTQTVSFSSWKDSLKRVELPTPPENYPSRENAVSSGKMEKKHRAPLPDFPIQHPKTSAGDSTGSGLREPAQPDEPLNDRPSQKRRNPPLSQFESSPLEIDNGRKKRSSSLSRTDAIISSESAAKSREAPVFDTHRLAEEVSASVIREINSMRSALEQQLALLNRSGEAHGAPVRRNLVSRLLDAGFSARFAHRLLDRSAHISDMQNDEKQAMAHVHRLLAENLETVESEDEILEKGGIYALVGPTGVGKTTTTAKLAARCVVRHGADKLALLTTDGYRIGGHEQLRIYGKILGVPVHTVRDAQDLAVILSELRGKHMVLIDTVGMSQRDEMVAEQVAMFTECDEEISRILLLNASSSLQTLDEVAGAYRGNGLAGAIITKIDEAVVSGGALEAAIRHRLPLYYVSTGQRVPEDLQLADRGKLIEAALEISPAFADSLPPDLFLPMVGRVTRSIGNAAGVPLD
ncbi:MAG TPA: flagellar biosynthesis protein FlhF [Nitrosospira sp.]|nr:flagellar biosynthesis protein FlhF [Nitrosospira sp.]